MANPVVESEQLNSPHTHTYIYIYREREGGDNRHLIKWNLVV